jgi:hypothetical protein
MPASVALAFALLASLAPLGPVARAQAPSEAQELPVVDGPTYVIYQTPDGDVSCRLALPGEFVTVGGQTETPVHQINHLAGKDSATASASAGLIIILRGTSQLEANPEAKQAFINAAAKWESLISTQITVTIDVDYGTTFFGEPYSSDNTLGATSSGGFRVPYGQVRSRLVSRATAGSEEATLVNNLPATSLPTDIGNVPDVFLPSSVFSALGFTTSQTLPVPRIGFNSKFTFDFNPNDGVVGTDFDSVAVHEIGHALGFTSQVGSRELDSTRPLMASVWDFYRFRPGTATAGTFSSAQRILSSGTSLTDPHVHFSGGAEIQLATGKPDGTGGDEDQASHWKDDSTGIPFIGIMDPSIRRGRHEEITANDLKAIDFFGYSLAATPPPPSGGSVIEFSAASYAASETGRSAALTLTRTNPNSTTESVGVQVRTADNAAAVRCDDTTTLPGVAFARCDYLSTSADVTFAPGEASKTFTVPLVDDAHGEPNEIVRVEIASPGGALFQIGQRSAADLVITSDEAAGQTGASNPLDGNSFFVRMQYLDFLNREPEQGEPWTAVLDRCPNVNNDPTCDRLIVSESFFRSPEFNLKGGFIFRFYKLSFNRLPEYAEIAADMRSLNGATAAEVFAKRSFFTNSWTARTEFTNAYSPLMTPAQFVNALMDRYQLQSITTPDPTAPDGDVKVVLTRQQLIDRMTTAALTRAQVVRAIADSDQVSAAEFRPAFVAMQYYGYLRRTPEPAGFNAWLNYLNQNPNDFRTMVGGFVNSQEYRLRFGRP